MDTQVFVYAKYQVFIDGEWRTIDLSKPFPPQIRGMRGYRMFTENGTIIRQSSLRV